MRSRLPPSSWTWSAVSQLAPSRAMTAVSAASQSGSESMSSPSMSNEHRQEGLAQTLKYFASGWWTTIASVDCSGCSCISSDSSTPIRAGSSSRATLARSARSGQAG